MKIGHCSDLQVMTEFTTLIRYKVTLVRHRYLNTLHFSFRPASVFLFLCCVLEVLFPLSGLELSTVREFAG